MADYIYEKGTPINTGSHGETDYVFASGEPVTNSGESDFVFESGFGLGGTGVIEISDGTGTESAAVGVIEKNQTVENFYDHEPDLYARGDVLNWAEAKTASFMFYLDTENDILSVIGIYDSRNSDSGGELDLDISNLPSGLSWAVTDDTPGVDSYNLNEPDATTDHIWKDNRTDGWALKDFSGESGRAITLDVTHLASNNGQSLNDVRGIGPNGEVKRSITSGTTVTLTLP